LERYEKDGHDFCVAIKTADKRIEECWIQRLQYGQAGGAIFYMKNKFGYRDVVENPGGGNTTIFMIAPEIAAKYAIRAAPARVIESTPALNEPAQSTEGDSGRPA
jgi:hypothetical protein